MLGARRSTRLWLCAGALALLAARAHSAPARQEWLFGKAEIAESGVARIELELDLRRPPELRGIATLHGTAAEGAARQLDFVLNRALEVERIVEDGVELEWRPGPRAWSKYHREGRLVRVERAARGGPWSLSIEYSGRGMTGSEGKDWMGILLLAADELRMSVQTVFYPQVDPDPEGPAVAPLPASVRVLAPEGFEVYVPGRSLGSAPAEGGGVAWSFASEHATVLSLFAAPRARRTTELGDAQVVTLLSDEHAHLAEPMASESRRILDEYARLWGPIGARTLGVCEIYGRGDSYNWAAQGIIALERGALREGLPVAKLAHEIAHLWWGQEVVASGRGERFLTESLAEYASWRYLAQAHGQATAQREIDAAEADWLREVHRRGADPALADVEFSTPGYSALAYSKGPLVLCALESRIGREALDALLREHRSSSAAGATLAGFLAAIAEHAGPPAEVAPWIEQAGHAHLRLEASGTNGSQGCSVQVEACPARCPELLPESVEIGARWPDRGERISVGLEAPRTALAGWEPPPSLIELDPRGLVLGELGGSLYQGPRGSHQASRRRGPNRSRSGRSACACISPRLSRPCPRTQPSGSTRRASRPCSRPGIGRAKAPASTRRSPGALRPPRAGRTLCIEVEGTGPARAHPRRARGLPRPTACAARAALSPSRPREPAAVVASSPQRRARRALQPRGVLLRADRADGLQAWRAELASGLAASTAGDEHVGGRAHAVELAQPLEPARLRAPFDARTADPGFELTTAGPCAGRAGRAFQPSVRRPLWSSRWCWVLCRLGDAVPRGVLPAGAVRTRGVQHDPGA